MNDVGERHRAPHRVWLAVVSLCLVQFLDVMGVTVVVTALPDVLSDLRASASAVSLVATGYAMFFGGLIAGSTLAAAALRHLRPRQVVAAGLGLIAVADLLLIWAAPIPWTLAACVAAAGAGIGLSSVAATTLGTDVAPARRGTAFAVINTAAQLGTALGIAVLTLVAALTTGLPRPGGPVPAVAWGVAAAIGLSAAAAFGLRFKGGHAAA